EASNNASAAGTLVPMLTLGLPTNATAAVMLAAFVQYGIQPGPLLFEREGDLVWALIASLFIGNTLLLLLNLPLAPLWAQLLKPPRPYLYAGILFFASVGAYAVNASTIDLIILLIIGLLGFAMRRYGLPVLPDIIAVILGPRRAGPRSCRTARSAGCGVPRWPSSSTSSSPSSCSGHCSAGSCSAAGIRSRRPSLSRRRTPSHRPRNRSVLQR